MNQINLVDIEAELANKSPKKIIQYAFENHEKVAISFSGAEDVLLIEYAMNIDKERLHVFTLDTGRLHPETYQFIEKVKSHYGITIEVLFPEAQDVMEFVKQKGLFSFYQDGHEECCSIRKVTPLRKKLATLDAWITGQRKDQSPGTRSDIPVIQNDLSFQGRGESLTKFNPLANYSSKKVWEEIRYREVPFNSLHDRGFISIGCEPCTRTVNPGQHEREGRWWWEENTKKECGLHLSNLSESISSSILEN